LVHGQPGQIVHETLSQKIPFTQKRAGEVAQALGSNPRMARKKSFLLIHIYVMQPRYRIFPLSLKAL
jgi:hypothetical protein